MNQRPLSPHLTVYRFFPTMALSILTRISGFALTVGLFVLVYWLLSAAAGDAAYARATQLLSGWFARLLLLGWLAAFCYHLVNGLRHLAWDAGYGFDKHVARRTGMVVVAVSVTLLLVSGYLLFVARCPTP